MDTRWTKVEDALPTEPGWYLVYAPNYYCSTSNRMREFCDGIMFSKFSIYKNGKRQWSIENVPWTSKYLVELWMPLPEV